MGQKKTIKKLNILGVEVDSVTYEEALSIFDGLINEDGLSLIATPNSEMIYDATKDRKLLAALDFASLVIPDGSGVLKAANILKHPLPERLTGIDFCFKALGLCEEQGKSVYFLGGKPGVAIKAAAQILQKYPKLKISGVRDGYFKDEEIPELIDDINKSGTDFLLLALGSPKQELFAFKNNQELKCRAAIGIGGSFDVWSGNIKRAPKFFTEHSLEWLYRLFQNPSRIKRVGKLPMFLIKVILTKRSR